MPSIIARSIRTKALLLLLIGFCPFWATAENHTGEVLQTNAAPTINEQAPQAGKESQISGIQVTDTGDLVFNVTGEGFEPKLSVRPLPLGQYQITISAPKTTLKDITEAGLNQQIQKAIPAIESTLLSQDGVGFQLNVTSWQALQPQIKSNSSHRVVITLVGSHNRPATTEAFIQNNKQPNQERPKTETPKPTPINNPSPALKPKAFPAKTTAQNPTIPKSVASRPISSKPEPEKTQQAKATERKAPKAATNVRIPSVTPNATALQVDWQPVYRKQAIAPQPSASERDVLSTEPLNTEPIHFLEQPEVTPPDHNLPEHSLQLKKTPTNDHPPALLPSNASFKNGAKPSNLTDQDDLAESATSYSIYAPSKSPALQRATADLTNGHPDNAELGLRALLEREPNHHQATYLLALINLTPALERLGVPATLDPARKEAAKQALEALISRQAFLPAYEQLIELALVDTRWDEVEPLLKQALQQFPESAWLWYQQGRLQEGHKDWAGAQAAYTKALALDEHQPECHYRLAQLHLKTENWDAARWELNQALAVAPDDARSLKLLGYVAEKQGKPQQAIVAYQAALQPDALLYYGRLIQQQNRSAEALILYQAVESMAQHDADLLLSLGTLYTEAKAFPRAQGVLKQLLKIVSDPTDIRLIQAKALLKQSSP